MPNNQKLKNVKTKVINYFLEAEYNVSHVAQLASFGIVTMLMIIYFIAVNDLLNNEHLWKHFWKMATIYMLPPAGKETAIPFGLYNELPQFLVGVSIVFLDLLIAIGTLTNWWIVEGAVKYLPPFKFHGKEVSAALWLHNLQETARKHRERKKYKFIVPLSLFAFYLIPFQGGSISTSIIGVLLGYKQRTILFIIGCASTVATIIWILLYYDLINLF